MQVYTYTARDAATGQKIKGKVEADSEKAAGKLVREQGLTPLDISLAGTGRLKGLNIFNRIRAKDKILFSRQLSTLINAGLPLVQSLRNVSGQTQNKALKVVIDMVIADVEGGSALSKALEKHPAVFNRIYISLIAAGETSGTLDAALERIAFQQEKDDEIMSKVKGAMVYPLVVLLVMVGVVGFMVLKVLPQVEVLYRDMPGTSLPLITRALLALSHFIMDFWPFVIVILIALGIFVSRWANTIGGRQVMDKLKMKAWMIGPLFMKLYMARFARTGTTLVASGVPLLQMMEITSQAINNVHISKSITDAMDKVRGGKSLADSITGDPNFLPLVPDMLRIGEQSGSVEAMLEKTADYYEKEVDNQIKTISTIIEPFMMIVLGIVAFIIVAAVLLPIYGLAGQSTLIK